MKPILCLDFDGVCHSYTNGWKGADIIPDPPVEGLFEFLQEANKQFEIHIFSSRSNQPGGIEAMAKWFEDYYIDWYMRPGNEFRELSLKFPISKPPAFLTIDDRTITFTGQWPNIEELKNFQPWYKKQGKE